MEEGGENYSCYKFNKDHLATGNDALNTRVENNIQWIVCGFNAFNQFKFENKGKLQQFKELDLTSNNAIVACSWTCFAISKGCSLQIQGFLGNAPNSTKIVKTESHIKAISICDKYCLTLLENGKVYKILTTINAPLEEIIFQRSLKHITPQKRNIFGNCKSEAHLEIAHIACGDNITVAVSKANEIFSGVTEIYKLPKHERIKQLLCGAEHALLLTTNGDIYSWGNGLRGQLGQEVLRVEETPVLITALAGVKVNFIAAGGWHSAAISSFGDIYTWGLNINGQLSLRIYKNEIQNLKEPSVYPLPQIIESPSCQCFENNQQKENKCFPLKIAAGGRHTLLKMSCGSIFACGWNKYGQLGLENFKEYCDNFHFVLKLDDNSKFNNKQIICGNWCSLIEK